MWTQENWRHEVKLQRSPLHTGGRLVRDHVSAVLVVAACVVVRRLALSLTEDLGGESKPPDVKPPWDTLAKLGEKLLCVS